MSVNRNELNLYERCSISIENNHLNVVPFSLGIKRWDGMPTIKGTLLFNKNMIIIVERLSKQIKLVFENENFRPFDNTKDRTRIGILFIVGWMIFSEHFEFNFLYIALLSYYQRQQFVQGRCSDSLQDPRLTNYFPILQPPR